MSILLVFFLIIIPALEIYLFISVGSVIGAGWTVFLVFLTAFLGVYALRQQGLSTLRQAQLAMQAGNPPVLELAHGVLIMIGGLFLLTPGFFTDALGFILMTNLGRIFIMEAVLATLIPTLFGGFDLSARRHDPTGPTGPMGPNGASGPTESPNGPRAHASQTTSPRDRAPRTIEADYRVDE